MAKWPKKHAWHDGVRMQFDYEDYIMSVVKFTGSYGYKKGLWEVAFMDRDTRDFVDPPLDFLSEYDNPDPGIYGSLNDPDVDRCHKSLSLISNYIGEH